MSPRQPSRSTLTVGVLLLSDVGVQYLDIGPVDVLSMLSKPYLGILGVPEHIAAQGLDLNIRWISETGQGMFPLSSEAKIAVTDSISTCPPLDILLIPGPPPDYQSPPAVSSFIYAHATSQSSIAVISICTGIIPLAQSGALAQKHAAEPKKRATGPLPLLPLLHQQSPTTTWDTTRWVHDDSGKIWTSGGVTNGLDCMAAFMRYYFWDRKEGVETALMAADVGDRAVEYSEEYLRKCAPVLGLEIEK